MTEQKITAELLAWLRAAAPDGVFLKLADRATIGVPDIAACARGKTTWLEIKLVRLGPKEETVRLADVISGQNGRAQLEQLCRLERAARAAYVVFSRRGSQWWVNVHSPRAVRADLHSSLRGESYTYPLQRIGKNFNVIIGLIKGDPV